MSPRSNMSHSPQRIAQKRKVSKIWTISCDNSETVRDRINQSSKQASNQFLKWPKWNSHNKDHWLGDISKLHHDYDWRNKKRFNSRRKVDSESAATTLVGSLFQMCGAATAKARLPTSDSFTATTRRLCWKSGVVVVHGKSSTRTSGAR